VTALAAFTHEEGARVQTLLALKVANMMGRKLEEDDWAEVYCLAKGIPRRGWSNLNIDVMHENLGVEQKMLGWRWSGDIVEACGTRHMHPSATRSIRIESVKADPNEVMIDVLGQYCALIAARRRKVAEQNASPRPVDMRTGWLLWRGDLRQFLYFEETMVAPDAAAYYAEWHERRAGSDRKASRNLWIYERATGRKAFSVTTSAGIKIQPYFDIPESNDPNLYIWTVSGERHETGFVRVWLTRRTADQLRRHLGSLEPDQLEHAIGRFIDAVVDIEERRSELSPDDVVAVSVPETAYERLVTTAGGVSDEYNFQLVAEHLAADDESPR